MKEGIKGKDLDILNTNSLTIKAEHESMKTPDYSPSSTTREVFLEESTSVLTFIVNEEFALYDLLKDSS